jgi:hypothetical protein
MAGWEFRGTLTRGSARAVAGFYHAPATHSLLSGETLAEAIGPQCAGPDRVLGGDSV